jgi:multidrug efflux pump subunit AcrB
VADITAILPDATTPSATLTVELSPRATRSQTQATIATQIDTQLAAEPDLRHRILTQTGRAPVELVLAGTDPARLDQAANTIARHLNGSLAALAIDAPLRAERTQAMDPVAAARAGVSRARVMDELRLFGSSAAALATLAGPDGRPVTLRLDLADSAIPLTTLHSDTGALVPLSAISHTTLALVPARIERQDGLTLRRLTAAPADGEAAADASRRLAAARADLAPDVTPLAAGDAAQRVEMMAALKQAMLTGLLLLGALLYALYRSIGQTLVILATLPLSLGGALIGLALTGQGLSLPVILAMLLLLGIVAKNAILIIDAAQSAIATGTAPEPALIAACQSRARPVVMTSLAIIGGMLPAAMGLGAGAGFRQPLAVAVISGITVATALSLFVVPILSLQAHRGTAALARLTRRFGHNPKGDAAHAT